MLTIGIPQLYCGASGKKGAYNRQEIGLARAFAAQGCRAVAFYPAPGARTVEREDVAENVRAVYVPAHRVQSHGFYKSWQPLLDEGVQVVHSMSDNQLAVPSLYRFCRKHGVFFYSQLGALYSDSQSRTARLVMDTLLHRSLAVYKKAPTFAKTPAMAEVLRRAGITPAGVMPVGLDTAIIPPVREEKPLLRRRLGLKENARYLLWVGRLDAYKRPLELVDVLKALGEPWRAVIIGQGSLSGALEDALRDAGLLERCVRVPSLANAAVQEYYHACDVYLNFNDHEIFGMSLLEAMWAGCPPAARHAPGPDLIIEDGVSGVLCGTTEDYPAAARKISGDPAMSAAAHRRIQEHFLWDVSARTALAMLRQHGVNTDG